MVVDEVHRVSGRVGGEHAGREGPLQSQRVRPVGQRRQPGPQRRQLRDRDQPDRRAGLGPTQMLGPLHRVHAQREAEGRGGQHRQVVVAARRPAGQGREDAFGADHAQVGEQQHRPGVTTAMGTGRDPRRAGAHRCRYAGAMLLFPYLGMVGAEG